MLSSPEVWRIFFEEYYQDKINELAAKVDFEGGGLSLHVDVLRDLIYYYEGRVVEELFDNPDVVIRHAEEGLALTDNIHSVSLEGCKVRFVNLPSTRRVLIRDLRSVHVSKFVAIEGIVRKVTEVRPKIVEAAFVCRVCGKEVLVPQEDGFTVRAPNECKACKSKNTLIFVPDKSVMVDSQRIRIQEYPENLKGGEQPQTIDVMLEGDLTGKINPGDRVVVNGIVRVKPRTSGTKKLLHMDIYLEGNSVEILQKEFEEFEIKESDVEKIIELSKDPDIYDKVVKSIAPSIYGHEDVKLAITLQLFGGVPKKLPDGTTIRGDIHVLLVGDPGIAKSQLIRYVLNIAPRSIYTTGKGTTGVGLTAAAVRDDVDGRWTLEAGALVLADKGIAIVDELDKMSKEDRNALHEVLEQQTVSISKAGITATLKARCALLAAANPKYGRFDRYTPFPEQIDLPPTLLSRFDLIFILTDDPDEERDSLLARHILDIHELGEKLAGGNAENEKEVEKVSPPIEPEMLKKYIAYAKKTVFPVLTAEAKERIEKFYTSMRSRAKENSPVPITARQLEAIIRLAEASARLRLSKEVTVDDAERAISLLRKYLEQVAVDPETGEVDIDVLTTGTAKSLRDKITLIKNIIDELEDLSNYGAPEDEIVKVAEERGIRKDDVLKILEKLKERGDVITPRLGHYRVVHPY